MQNLTMSKRRKQERERHADRTRTAAMRAAVLACPADTATARAMRAAMERRS